MEQAKEDSSLRNCKGMEVYITPCFPLKKQVHNGPKELPLTTILISNGM